MELTLKYSKTLENLLLYSVQTAIQKKKNFKHFIKNIAVLLAKKGYTGEDIITNLPLVKKDKKGKGKDDVIGEDDRSNNIQSENEVSIKYDIKKIISDNPCLTLLNLHSLFLAKRAEINNQAMILHNMNKRKNDEELELPMTFLNKKRAYDN